MDNFFQRKKVVLSFLRLRTTRILRPYNSLLLACWHMRFASPRLVQDAKTTVECTHGTNSTYVFESRPAKIKRRGNHPSIINVNAAPTK